MCNCELIAVMDTDDVSLPKRFEKQLAVFENQDVDVCGAWIGEFELNETQIISYRRTPEQHNEIVAFAKGRSPVNHVTAMYKKSWVLNVGNYAKYRTSEDYNLFVKLIMTGAKISVSITAINSQLHISIPIFLAAPTPTFSLRAIKKATSILIGRCEACGMSKRLNLMK
jgi:hypothetical protein